MRILLIRHGESEADILNVHEGRADFELTEKGHQQAVLCAKYLKEHYEIQKIYASTLKRANQTAMHIADELHVPVIDEDKLREHNNGLLAGLPIEEAAKKYPHVPNVPIHTAVYEQESVLEFRFRAEYMLSKIISENEEDAVIAIVTHGGMINQLYQAFLKLPVTSNVVFPTDDTGIHEWVIGKDRSFIVASNRKEHLAKL